MPIEPERSQPVDEPELRPANEESTPRGRPLRRETPRRAAQGSGACAATQKPRRAMAPPTDRRHPQPRPCSMAAEDAESLLDEANANTRAMIETTDAIIRADTIDEVIRASLDTIRKAFGWAYASYWTVDPAENALVFSLESGRVDDEFQRLTRTARFREGEGLNGRAWRHRDLFFVDDLGELRDCCRAPLASRAGIHAAIALPVLRDGQVVGTHGLLRDRGRGGQPDPPRGAADRSASSPRTRSRSWTGSSS